MKISININELTKAFEMITEILKSNFGDEIEFDSDYYWVVDFPERKDFRNEPTELSTGSLADDIESLRKAINDEFITLVDFERFANIIFQSSDLDLY